MKLVITAFVVLFVSSGLVTTTWGCTACTTPKGGSVVLVSEKSEATVTLAVRGMMKSKSGAT